MVAPPDAVVVGSGPNGLAAAITLPRGGLTVEVLEGAPTPGGGCRTEALTLPGFLHDVCSAVHPLLSESTFFQGLDLSVHGVELCVPPVAFAHPLGGEHAGFVVRSIEETASAMGEDARSYRRTFSPLVRDRDHLVPSLLAPLRSPPSHPLAIGRFLQSGLFSARHLSRRFRTEEARAVIAGAAAHSQLSLDRPLTASYALLFALMAHSSGWPLIKGGTARVVDAMVDELGSLGGHVTTGRWVRSLDELRASRLVLLDVSPRQLIALAGARLPKSYERALAGFRYGPGVCKVDYAFREPVPWSAAACRLAGTVHVGGHFEEVARSESEVAAGRHAEEPFCLVVQPGVVNSTRAPEGRQTLWAYCHVPSGSTRDVTERIEAQIERFAPGFKDVVLERATTTAVEFERHNPNYVGGDVSGGLASFRQTLFRPVVRWNPYRTPLDGVYLCSASTPPGGGVHGMCGFHAANVALADLKGRGAGRRAVE